MFGTRRLTPTCPWLKWEQLLKTRDIHQVNLYTCAPSVEKAARGVGLATLFQVFAPRDLVDTLTRAFENQSCHDVQQWSPEKKNKWIADLMTDFGIAPDSVPGCRGLTVRQCAAKFPSVNAFFTRPILPEDTIHTPAQQLAWAADEGGLLDLEFVAQDPEQRIVTSPAECYAVMYPDVSNAHSLWIKGKNFTVTRLLGSDRGGLYESAVTVVCRLTPKHYHRFHSPVTGYVVAMGRLGTRDLSVQRRVVNSTSTNVLTENVRYLLYVRTRYFGIVCIVIVGATCVASIQFRDRALDDVRLQLSTPMPFAALRRPIPLRQNEVLGAFLYGGSTILVLVPEQPANFMCTRILDASERQIETEIAPGQPLVYCSP